MNVVFVVDGVLCVLIVFVSRVFNYEFNVFSFFRASIFVVFFVCVFLIVFCKNLGV